MPRGVKISTIEKLNRELEKVRAEIRNHEDAIVSLNEKEKEVLEEIKEEEYKQLKTLMDGKGLSINDIIELIDKQSAKEEAAATTE